MLNILFSTTRQFNVGDEAILLGILNVFDSVIGRNNYNPIIYNRNPDIRKGAVFANPFKTKRFTNKNIKGKRYIKSLFDLDMFDNSIKDDSDYSNIDLVVFAGTPEWYGDRLKSLYKAVTRFDIHVIYIGIGAGENYISKKITKIEKKVLSTASIITVRDKTTVDILTNYKPLYIPCPALQSGFDDGNIIKEVKKVGLIYSSYRISPNNRISKETDVYLKKLYAILVEKYDVEFVCHYVDEIDEIEKEFPHNKYYYSYNVQDYFSIYKHFDYVIGCRVHGLGIAASVGIPGVIIKHDCRGNTADGFCSVELVANKQSIEDGIIMIDNAIRNVEIQQKEIRLKRGESFEKYKETLSSFLNGLKD